LQNTNGRVINKNEQVCTWFLQRFPQFQAIQVDDLAAYQSHLTNIPCYLMFPQNGLGAGAFTVLFKNTSESTGNQLDVNMLESLYIYSQQI
jgi:hypothetical protein